MSAKDKEAKQEEHTHYDECFHYHVAFFVVFSCWAASYFIAFPVPVDLIVLSTGVVVLGSYRSLLLLDPEAIPLDEKQALSSKDAMKMPIIAGISLYGLYYAFKNFDKDTVNMILACYFSVAGVATLTSTFSPFAAIFIRGKKKYGFKKTFPLIGEIDLTFTRAEQFCLVISIAFAYAYYVSKHYMLNNVLGISFCVQGLEKVSIGSYKIGAGLLAALFFYDIFWVFGTDVMITVAKSFDGPIKILIPRVLPDLANGVKGEFSLLGLGDIVIPGLFVALLLRYDATVAKVHPQGCMTKRFPKPYFTSCAVAYALGLAVTLGVMYVYDHGQPALLYLVPSCLGCSLLVAFWRGDGSRLFAYDEETAMSALKAEAEKEAEKAKEKEEKGDSEEKPKSE